MAEIRHIVVYLDGWGRDRAVLELAAGIGARLRASLEADFVRIRDGAISESEFSGGVERLQAKFEQSARAAFDALKQKAEVEAEFRVLSGQAAPELVWRARMADLVVIGQPTPDGSAGDYSIPADVVIAAGVPVLIVPAQGSFADAGRRALVAWKHARETTRALRDALPLLAKAEQVTVLNIEPEHEPKTLALEQAGVKTMLQRHGIRATVEVAEARGRDVHELLLAKASEIGADLLVMGAYGRSRFREMLTGGVTHGIMSNMTLPVLMSH
jgi:nucleotide-binding universal stress UspA family protein